MGVLDVAAGLSVAAFVRGLQELGYVDGKNIIIERRLSGTPERLPDAAAELARLNVAAIFAPTTISVKAAREATSTIPIVFSGVADPVSSGFAASLARPGGAITGLTPINAEISAKRLQLLKETVSGLTRVGYLYEAGDGFSSSLTIPELHAAARALGLSVHPVEVRGAEALDEVFAAMGRDRIGALVTGGGLFRFRARIAERSLRHRMPVLADSRLWVEAGALLTYGASYEELASEPPRVLRRLGYVRTTMPVGVARRS